MTSVSATSATRSPRSAGAGQGSVFDLDRPLMLLAEHERPGELAVEGDGPGVPDEVGELRGGGLEERQRSVRREHDQRCAELRDRAGDRRAVTEPALDLGRSHEVALRRVVVGREGSRATGSLEEDSLGQVGGHAERLVEERDGLRRRRPACGVDGPARAIRAWAARASPSGPSGAFR